MNFLWSLLGALLPAAAGMLVLIIGAFCSLFSLDANSQMGPGIGLIFVAAAIRLLDRKKRLMLAPRPYPRKPFAKALVFVKMAQGHSSGAFYYAQTPARRFFVF